MCKNQIPLIPFVLLVAWLPGSAALNRMPAGKNRAMWHPNGQDPAGLEAEAETAMLNELMKVDDGNQATELHTSNAKHAQFGPFTFEFGYQMSLAVPMAYKMFLDGTLQSTSSCGDLSAMYWFSPKHTNLGCKMVASPNPFRKSNKQFKHFSYKSWFGTDDTWPSALAPPPHKEHYKPMPMLTNFLVHHVADAKVPERRSIFIANKFDSNDALEKHKYFARVGGHSENYFSESLLQKMIDGVKDKCPNTQIVYARNDLERVPHYHGDFELIRKYDHVVDMADVRKANEGSFNEIQMRAWSKHNCFASVQGGFMTAPALFGGKHVVLHRTGSETDAFYARLAKWTNGTFQVVRPKHPEDVENQFMQAFTAAFLADGCQACQMEG